jgi:thiol-disulfide isomerase/thioredoxin
LKTSFTSIDTNATSPTELSWYYSSYTKEYKPVKKNTAGVLLSNGTLAPDWKLETYNNNKTISLSNLKGQIILLDFWIKNCGPCIQSVPYLNELQNKFKDKNFKLISVNSYDSKEDISWFCNKHNTVLMNGKIRS